MRYKVNMNNELLYLCWATMQSAFKVLYVLQKF